MTNLIPRTWKSCENEEILHIYLDVCEFAIKEGLIKDIPPLFLFKSTKKWGECRLNKLHTVIGLNQVFLDDPAKSTNTIIHELAHAILPSHGHDEKWRNVANKIGELYGEEIKRGRSQEEVGISLHNETSHKYTVECPHCHYQWYFQRMCDKVKYPHLYMCGVCNEHLVRVK